MVSKMRLVGFMYGWKWRLRHCWILYLIKPIRIQDARPAWVSVTILDYA